MINEHAPDAIKNGEIKNHFGRKVAIVSLPCTTLEPLTDVLNSIIGCVSPQSPLVDLDPNLD